jgi:hypothetical protein
MENENPQSTEVTTRSVGIKYGLITGGVAILYFLIMIIAGIDMSQGIGRWGSLIFYVALIFLAQKNFKENGNGFMSYGQGMGITFWLALVTCVVSSVFTYIYVKFIDVSFIQQMLEKQEEAMIEQGMSQEQVAQAMRITQNFMTPEMMFVFGLIFGVIIIIIVGLLVTIFTKKSNPEMPI